MHGMLKAMQTRGYRLQITQAKVQIGGSTASYDENQDAVSSSAQPWSCVYWYNP